MSNFSQKKRSLSDFSGRETCKIRNLEGCMHVGVVAEGCMSVWC